MKLYIDTSNSEKITVGINDDDDMVVEDAKKEKSQRLLGIINRRLREEGKSLKDIAKIEVNRGPGSFTGLRVGVSVANALGWLLGVPVNDKDIKKEGPVEPVYS